MTDIKSISAGSYHSLIMKNDNSVWACGRNQFGEFGKGVYSTTNSSYEKIMDNVKSFEAGNGNSFIIKNNDSLYVTGYNAYGQLGVGDEFPRRSFVGVQDSAKTVISSGSASCASTFVITLRNKLIATGTSPNYKLGTASNTATNNFNKITLPN